MYVYNMYVYNMYVYNMYVYNMYVYNMYVYNMYVYNMYVYIYVCIYIMYCHFIQIFSAANLGSTKLAACISGV
jgi:hypothetical protein